MRKKVKHYATTIRISEDGKTWSNEMGTFDFVRRYKDAQLKAVEITEVMSKKDALGLIKNDAFSLQGKKK